MFLAYEQALLEHMDGVVSGAVVSGTFDEQDLEGVDVFVQVVWQGYRIDGQSGGKTEAALAQLFAVRIGAGQARLDPARTADVVNGLAAVLRRVMSFKYELAPHRYVRPTLLAPPPPAYQGAAAELAVYFSLPGVVVADQ